MRINSLVLVSKQAIILDYTIEPIKLRYSVIIFCQQTRFLWKSIKDKSESIVELGRKANHNNLASEPHSPNFLVRATSKSSTFQYCFFIVSTLILPDKTFLKNRKKCL